MSDRVSGLVSIIVPCFQQGRFIAEALESVQGQSYQNWECIVVDDGSTDNSKEVIVKFALEDERIRYLYQDNAGVSAARNHGFAEAKGGFINFLDGDDLFRPDKLRRQVEHLNANPAIDWCYCDHVHRFETKGIEEHYEAHPLGPNPLEDFLFYWDRGLSIPPHCGMFRRTIWPPGETPFDPEYKARWEDWVFWIELCLRGCKPAFIDHQDAVYRIHSTNFSSDLEAGVQNAIRAAFFISPKLPGRYRESFLSETIGFHMARYGQWKIETERNRSALHCFFRKLAVPVRRILGPSLFGRLKKSLL